MEPCRQVADGIYQVPLPLPFALRIVNCYLLRDDDRWVIVDTGLHTSESRSVWQAVFAALAIGPGDISRIVLTHFHPDHFGGAGWLYEWTGGAPVLISPRDAEQARMVWGKPDAAPEPMLAEFLVHGAPTELAVPIVEEVQRLRVKTRPHPPLTPLAPGATLTIGQRSFRAIHAPGHSDGQLVFYAADEGLVLCGDQVLIKITPHIGVWPESEPDPLGRYLASLTELERLEVGLALPGHGPLITSWRARLLELRYHHDQRLDEMRAAVGEAATAYEVAQQVFDFSRLTRHEMRFALAETVAHLDFLLYRGRLRREQEGAWVYRPAA